MSTSDNSSESWWLSAWLASILTSILRLVAGEKCPYCGHWSKTIDRRHRNTSYCEAYDDMNYLTSCIDCYKDDCEVMAERWADYYSGCM